MANEFYDGLACKAKKTSFARFEASRRMNYLNNVSTVALSVISIFIIAINLLVFIDGVKRTDVITVVTVILSTFVLALSLIISQQLYQVKKNELSRSANELNEFSSNMIIKRDSSSAIGDDENQKDNQTYNEIIKKCQYNHDPIDFECAITNESIINTLKKLFDKGINDYDKKKRNIAIAKYYLLDVSFLYIICIVIALILSIITAVVVL